MTAQPDLTSNVRDHEGTPIPTPGTFVLDVTHTRVGFVARHLMVTKVRGNFETFEGSITLAEDPAQSVITATLQTGSITTHQPDRDAHLRSGDFLEIEQYPTITFVSREVRHRRGDAFTVAGDLTIKGVTREVELDATLDGITVNPFSGAQVIGFSAETEIDREDFGITWNVALETGGVMVSKKIKIEIEGEAIRQDAPQA